MISALQTAAVGDDLPGLDVRLDQTAVVRQVSGGQDWAGIHHDHDYAVKSGHEGIFFNTSWTQGMLSRLLTDWIGPDGWLSHLEFQMRKMNVLGDVVRVRGRVTGCRAGEAGSEVLTLDVWLENERVGVTTPGKAEVIRHRATTG